MIKEKNNMIQNIKIIGLLIIAASLNSGICYSQTFEITPSYGYQFGSKLNDGPNYLKIDDSDQFGITIGFETYYDIMAELSYIHQGTELRIRDVFFGPSEIRLADQSIDWILVGGTKYFPSGNIRPFIGGALGLAIFSVSNQDTSVVNIALDGSTKFAFSFKGGFNIMFSNNVGLNLQGNLMFPVDWGGVYAGGGTGGFSGGVGVTSTTIIAGFSGGLVFRFN
jgi:hypothetical protein